MDKETHTRIHELILATLPDDTLTEVVERCMLMATQPGDLVLDPTCGSGTTAYVAEQWGRRWITCDTSRVPLALARERLLTATFPWYELKEPQRGPAGGFVYQRKQNRKGGEVGGLVPRITLKSIANNEQPEMATLVDRPEVNKKVTRVCGPFAVEATIQAATVLDETVDRVGESGTRHRDPGRRVTAAPNPPYENPRAYLDRMIEVLRRAHTLRLPGNQALELESVRPVADCEWLHAEAITEANGNACPGHRSAGGQRVAVAFGPEDGAIHSQFVYEAAREAHFLKYDQLYLFGFAIQAEARELVENRAKLRIPVSYVSGTDKRGRTTISPVACGVPYCLSQPGASQVIVVRPLLLLAIQRIVQAGAGAGTSLDQEVISHG